MNYFFPKYIKEFRRENVVAVFNSLRMRPVFLTASLFDQIKNEGKKSVSSKSEIWRQNIGVFELLIKNKILIHDEDNEELPLLRAKESIGKPYPHVLYLILTDNCNMMCKYCFLRESRPENYPETSMSFKTAEKALFLFSTGLSKQPKLFGDEKNIIFYGGEPLINFPVLKDTVKIIEKLQKTNGLPQNTKKSIITNGTLITKEIASFFRDKEINVGISLDGDRLITNKNRKYKSENKDAYDDILDGLNKCKEAKVDVGLSVTITPASLKNKKNIIDTIINLGIKSLGFNIYMGKKENVSPAFFDDCALFLTEAFSIFRNEGIYEDRLMRKTEAFVNGDLYLYDCAAAGGNQLVIAPNGDIGICHGFLSSREFFFGNVHSYKGDIEKEPIYLEWANRSPVTMPECHSCYALSNCGGGCPFNAYINTGSIWGLDERFCTHAKHTLEWLIWDVYEQMEKTTEPGV